EFGRIGGGGVGVVVVRRRRGIVVVVGGVGDLDLVAGAVAEGLDEVVDDRRRRGAVVGGELVAENAGGGGDRHVFRERDAEADFAGGVAGAVARGRGGRLVVVAVAERVADADPVV